MIILCSEKTEYGDYNPKDLQNLTEAFQSLEYDVSVHKIQANGKIFPRFPEDKEFIVGIGLNERKLDRLDGIVFSVMPTIISNRESIDYRFVKSDNMFILSNVNNLPLNANIVCYCLKSVAYTIRKMVIDQWELTDVTRT